MTLVFNYDKDLPSPLPLKAKYLEEQVLFLKNIFQPEQKTKEWYDMRHGMLTASDWGTVLGMNHYSNPNEVLRKKCGDDSMGFFSSPAMAWGNKYEDVAVLIYKHRNNVEVWDFGCLQHPFIPYLGASPDGITPKGVMLEIKCPTSRKITGVPPPYYWCQVQGQLEVCDLDRCDFLECSLKEYESTDEKTTEELYLEDNYESNFKLNKYGNEKGVIAEFYRKKENNFYFVYSPVNLIGEELKNWKEEMNKKHCDNSNIFFSCYYYWYLVEVSCVPIYRNAEWFHEAKIKLGEFWAKVIKYRNLGIEKLLEDIKNEKEKAKEMKEGKKKVTVDDVMDVKKQKKIKDYINLDISVVDKQGKEIKESIEFKEKEKKVKKGKMHGKDIDDFIFQTNTCLFFENDEINTSSNP